MTADLHARYAELESALAPLRAAHPGMTCQEAAPLLPEHLRAQLWERAVDRYLTDELAKLGGKPLKITVLATILDAPEGK